VVSVSAQTRQRDLDGSTVWEKPPTDPTARLIFETGAAVEGVPDWSDAALFALAAERLDTCRVIRWVHRAAAEGVIATSGGER
jgi:hypothetical protein